jgi:mono/diheme cytochrome c family protein
LEDQALKKDSAIRNLIVIVLAILLAGTLTFWGIHQIQMSDPYVRQVMALSGDPQQGKAIFVMNCSGCHGLDAQGEVGPSLWKVAARRSQIGLIRQVTSGKTPPMPKFQVDPVEMADLLSFLNTL